MENTQVLELTEDSSSAASIIAPSRFVNGPAMVLAGLIQPYTDENMGEIPAQWGRFVPYIDTMPGRVGRAEYGVIVNTPDRKGFDYLAAVEVSGTSALPADMTRMAIPAQRYAVFPHPGHVSTLCETIDAAFSKWLPESGHTLTGAPDLLEHYGENFDPEIGAGDIEIWLPVKGGKGARL